MFALKFISGECHITSLTFSQHWFKWCLGAMMQEAIIWSNVDPHLQHHILCSITRTQWVKPQHVHSAHFHRTSSVEYIIFIISKSVCLINSMFWLYKTVIVFILIWNYSFSLSFINIDSMSSKGKKITDKQSKTCLLIICPFISWMIRVCQNELYRWLSARLQC